MSKILSGVGGMPRFLVCMVVDRTNQNIGISREGKTESYPMRTGHVMLVEIDDNY
jgi:hypothetical protein